MFDFIKNDLKFHAALGILEHLGRNGFRGYVAGGAVRDLILGRRPHDYDIASPAPPEKIALMFPQSYLVGASFGIVNVISGGFNFEIATFREEREYSDGRHPEKVIYTDSPEKDAARRDFTVNAMFYDPMDEKVLDFFNGREDLANGILRTVGDPGLRFSEDYLRILRAVRFAVQLDLQVAPEMMEPIRILSPMIGRLSAERIRDEISKIIADPNAARGVALMDELCILSHILPEISAMKGVGQSEKYHPEGDVFMHTLLMLEHMGAASPELAWAILLHDVGKPPSAKIGEDGINHFYGHEKLGAEIAQQILSRLKMPGDFIRRVSTAVGRHMAFSNASVMKASKWKRLLAEDSFPLELELHRIDCISSHRRMDNYIFFLDRLHEMENEVELPPPLLRGADLIELGLKPGPSFKKILGEAGDLQLEGKLRSREDALEWLKILTKN